MIEVSPVTKDAVKAIWPDVEGYVRLAIDRTDGEYKIEDIYKFCNEGKMQLLVAHEGYEVYGAVISEVVKYPGKTVLQCFALGGRDLERWINKVVDRFREGCENVKADYCKAYTRPGIAKMLKKYGAKVRCYEVVL